MIQNLIHLILRQQSPPLDISLTVNMNSKSKTISVSGISSFESAKTPEAKNIYQPLRKLQIS